MAEYKPKTTEEMYNHIVSIDNSNLDEVKWYGEKSRLIKEEIENILAEESKEKQQSHSMFSQIKASIQKEMHEWKEWYNDKETRHPYIMKAAKAAGIVALGGLIVGAAYAAIDTEKKDEKSSMYYGDSFEQKVLETRSGNDSITNDSYIGGEIEHIFVSEPLNSGMPYEYICKLKGDKLAFVWDPNRNSSTADEVIAIKDIKTGDYTEIENNVNSCSPFDFDGKNLVYLHRQAPPNNFGTSLVIYNTETGKKTLINSTSDSLITDPSAANDLVAYKEYGKYNGTDNKFHELKLMLVDSDGNTVLKKVIENEFTGNENMPMATDGQYLLFHYIDGFDIITSNSTSFGWSGGFLPQYCKEFHSEKGAIFFYGSQDETNWKPYCIRNGEHYSYDPEKNSFSSNAKDNVLIENTTTQEPYNIDMSEESFVWEETANDGSNLHIIWLKNLTTGEKYKAYEYSTANVVVNGLTTDNGVVAFSKYDRTNPAKIETGFIKTQYVPYLKKIPDATIGFGEEYKQKMEYGDADGDSLEVIVNGEAFQKISETEFELKPEYRELPGTYPCSVEIREGNHVTISPFNLTVAPDTTPDIEGLVKDAYIVKDAQAIKDGFEFRTNITISDIDNDTITLAKFLNDTYKIKKLEENKYEVSVWVNSEGEYKDTLNLIDNHGKKFDYSMNFFVKNEGSDIPTHEDPTIPPSDDDTGGGIGNENNEQVPPTKLSFYDYMLGPLDLEGKLCWTGVAIGWLATAITAFIRGKRDRS